MRFSASLTRALPFLAGVLATAVTSPAYAEEEFDLATAHGKIVLTTKGEWHVNPEYPWTLTIDGKKVEKARFDFDKAKGFVRVEAPPGEGTLRGGVCNGGQCRSFTKAVKVP